MSVLLSVDTLAAVSALLETRTVAAARSHGDERECYTPWLGVLPLLPEFDIPNVLKDGGGSLIETKHAVLLGVVQLIMQDRRLLADHLIGTDEDWQICVDLSARPGLVPALMRGVDAVRSSSILGGLLPVLVRTIIPLKQPRARGLSSDLFRGVVFLGAPDEISTTDIALDLAHEMGHQALSLIHSGDPIFTSDPWALVHSEVRHTLRPAVQSLHACAALSFMARYAADAGCPEYVHPDLLVPSYVALQRGIATLRSQCSMTEVGLAILGELETLASDSAQIHLAVTH